jgi:hypothetical protein
MLVANGGIDGGIVNDTIHQMCIPRSDVLEMGFEVRGRSVILYCAIRLTKPFFVHIPSPTQSETQTGTTTCTKLLWSVPWCPWADKEIDIITCVSNLWHITALGMSRGLIRHAKLGRLRHAG